MKKIAWVVDSTTGLSDSFLKENNVFMLPINVIFGEDTFRERIDLPYKEFYEKLKSSAISPKTSQPNLGEIVETFEKIKDQYEHAIAFTVSKKVSGTFSTFMAAREMAGLQIEVIDSESGGYGIDRLLLKGLELESKGEDINKIKEELVEMNKNIPFYVIPSNLEQLKKSGRVDGMKYLIGSLLNIKPILSVEQGEIKIVDKIRTEKKIKKWIEQKIEDQKNTVSYIAIMHSNDEEKAMEYKTLLEEKYPSVQIGIFEFSMTFSVHAGEGTIAFSWE